jgi:hypothetical protein
MSSKFNLFELIHFGSCPTVPLKGTAQRINALSDEISARVPLSRCGPSASGSTSANPSTSLRTADGSLNMAAGRSSEWRSFRKR